MSGILSGIGIVLSGIVNSGLDILGGTEYIENNTASNTSISSGGLLSLVTTNVIMPATAIASMIVDGGSEIVGSASKDISSTVDDGGSLIVSSGGLASGTALSGVARILSGGSALGLELGSGGLLDVASGALVSGVSAASGAIISLGLGGEILGATIGAGTVEGGLGYVLSGGVLSSLAADPPLLSVIASGGTEVLSAGVAAVDVKIGSGGLLNLLSGAAGSGLDISGGSLQVLSGALTSGDILSAGSLLVQSGGSALDLLVGSGAELNVASGAVVVGVTASSGAVVSLGLGGILSGAALNSGALIESGLGYVLSGGVLSGLGTTPALGAVVGSGVSEILNSGLAADLTVGSGGLLSLGAGATGSELVISGGVLSLGSGALVSDTISFLGSGGTLILNNDTPVGLSGFGNGVQETVILSGLPFSSGATLSSIGSALLVNDGGSSITLNLSGLSSAVHVQLGNAGGVLEISAPCFAAGTRLLTPAGDALVETLVPGDEVVTVRDGGPATRKVVWTGRRATDLLHHPHPERVRPVRILAGAFGQGVPERDLRVSPNHAIYIDGALFEAISLVNGISIIQEITPIAVTYYHIELDEHDIVLAEGLPVESFLDTGNRDMFETTTGVMQMFPDFRTADNAPTCVALHRTGPEVARAHAGLAALAAGFAARPAAKRA